MAVANTTLNQPKKQKKLRSKKHENLIGPTDPKIDFQARERLVTARIGLLLRHSFFGNLATRLKLINADEWCSTAATDGLNFYYNSRFIMLLKVKEVEFLVGHEVLHVVYDHMGRRMSRDPQMWNIADDYVVNADLKKHKIGQFITSVPCLYEQKYDGKCAEEVYDDLMKNVQKISIDDLIDQMLDDHMEGNQPGDDDGEGDKEGKGGMPTMSKEEAQAIRDEIKEAMIQSAAAAGAGDVRHLRRVAQRDHRARFCGARSSAHGVGHRPGRARRPPPGRAPPAVDGHRRRGGRRPRSRGLPGVGSQRPHLRAPLRIRPSVGLPNNSLAQHPSDCA